MNFASFVTPGGGVTRGTTAQEESICRISTLYKGIADDSVRLFYDSHKDKINNKQTNINKEVHCLWKFSIIYFRAYILFTSLRGGCSVVYSGKNVCPVSTTRNLCVCRADSFCYTIETNTTL